MITVEATFVMAPDADVVWEEVWPHAHAAYAHARGMRAASLFRDMARPDRYVLHSEWEARDDANAFVRSSGLLWLIRGLDLLVAYPTFRYVEGDRTAPVQ